MLVNEYIIIVPTSTLPLLCFYFSSTYPLHNFYYSSTCYLLTLYYRIRSHLKAVPIEFPGWEQNIPWLGINNSRRGNV